MITYRKVGGLRFVTIGRLNLSWSVAAKLRPMTLQEEGLVSLCWSDEMNIDKAARRFGVSRRQMVQWYAWLDAGWEDFQSDLNAMYERALQENEMSRQRAEAEYHNLVRIPDEWERSAAIAAWNEELDRRYDLQIAAYEAAR